MLQSLPAIGLRAALAAAALLRSVAVRRQAGHHRVGGRRRRSAANEPAAGQRFRTFSRVEDTIEWRGVKGKARFAMIQRWWLTDPAGDRPATRMAGRVVW